MFDRFALRFHSHSLPILMSVDRIRPICLPFADNIINQRFVGSNPFLAGWGVVTQRTSHKSPILMQAQIPVTSNEQCLAVYKYCAGVEFSFDDKIVCTRYELGDIDSCKCDSGGPLMLPIHQNGSFPFYQIGIVSWADGCALPNLPGVNTNVQYFIDWIKMKLTNMQF